MKKVKLMLGDNMESLKKLPPNSIDSIVSDPPYGLSFMGKKWDYDVPSVDFWKEVYRVLKPGGHVLSFGGTRTYHRMVVNIEDAGFEIRDQIMWIYGSGFPKSHNIGKSVDKLNGNEREVVGEMKQPRMNNDFGKGNHNEREIKELDITKGTSEWEGFGTALKPANEPICLARKPLSEKSVAENVLKWRTGGINVDGCRVGTELISHGTSKMDIRGKLGDFHTRPTIEVEEHITEGRFPANIIFECICDEVIKGEKGEVKKSSGTRKGLDITHEWGYDEINRTTFTDKGDIHTNPDCPCRLLDEQTGYLKSGEVKPHHKKNKTANGYQGSCYGKFQNEDTTLKGYGDGGGASRFFYQAKVSKAERNMGLEEGKKSNHPTVKPINLMTYLCRLITPPNGIVLDPFMGSGSTGIAAQLEGFRFVGMEMDEDYFNIAEARIENFEKYKKFIK